VRRRTGSVSQDYPSRDVARFRRRPCLENASGGPCRDEVGVLRRTSKAAMFHVKHDRSVRARGVGRPTEFGSPGTGRYPPGNVRFNAVSRACARTSAHGRCAVRNRSSIVRLHRLPRNPLRAASELATVSTHRRNPGREFGERRRGEVTWGGALLTTPLSGVPREKRQASHRRALDFPWAAVRGRSGPSRTCVLGAGKGCVSTCSGADACG
jgi:hypothetical protein